MNLFATAPARPAELASFQEDLQLDQAPPDLAAQLCAMGEHIALKRGEVMPGELGQDRLIYLAKGSAKLIASSGKDQNQVLAFYFAGDVATVLQHHGEDIRLIALTELELVSFPSGAFLDLAQGAPEVLRSVLARSLQALHRSREKMMQLGNRSARHRVADFLVSIAERTNGCSSGLCQLDLPMSRRDIADSLCLTIETVSRQFTELRELGLLETQGRSGVILFDLQKLAAEAGHTKQITKNRRI